MARHAKNPTRPRLLSRLWPFRRHRANPLDRLVPAKSCPKWTEKYPVRGVARVPHLPERPLLTLAGEYRAGCWS